MALTVKYYNEFRPESTNFPLENIQGKMRIEIEVGFSNKVLATSDNPMVVGYIDGVIQVAGTTWLYDPLSQFEDFNVGDVIVIGDYATMADHGDYTITEKQDDGLIRVSPEIEITGVVPPAESEYVHLIVSTKTPVNAVAMYWNFIENSEALNFLSKIDGSTQLFKANSVDATNPTAVPMTPIGNVEYQFGGATIEGDGILDTFYYESRFKLIHYTFLTPFVDALVTSGITSGTPPTYYQLTKCLKHVLKLEGYYDYADPNRRQEIFYTDVQGNTGWYGENFNTNTSDYAIDSIVFKKADNITVIPSLELITADQYVEVTIKSNTSSFSNNNTKFTLNIIKCPYDATEYIGNSRYGVINFCFDRALQTVGAASVNGDYFSTVNQSLKVITGQFINTTTIKILFRVAYSPQVVSIIQESEIPNFLISIAIQNHNKASIVSDRVNLIAALKDYYIDTSDPTMIGVSNKFLSHYENDPDTEGSSTINAHPSEEIVAYSRFYIDQNGRTADEIKLQSLTCKIIARNVVTLEEFTLDQFSQNLSTLPVLPDGWQYINSAVNRPFHIPVTEIRKQVRIKRRADLDAAGLFYYDVLFPFIMRWEYFSPLPTADLDFFNPLQPNNGLNHFWHHYDTGNWRIYYELSVTATKNGILQGYKTRSQIRSSDWNSSTTWNPETIKSYDVDTGTEIIDPAIPRKYILGYKKTRIEAVFTNTTTPIDLDKIVMAASFGRWENDNFITIRRFSSINPMSSDTWMESTDSSNLIFLSQPTSTQVKGEFLIDNSLIPNYESFAIYVVFYDNVETTETFFKLKESGEIKQLEDGQNKILE